jgi:hypothetical protein
MDGIDFHIKAENGWQLADTSARCDLSFSHAMAWTRGPRTKPTFELFVHTVALAGTDNQYREYFKECTQKVTRAPIEGRSYPQSAVRREYKARHGEHAYFEEVKPEFSPRMKCGLAIGIWNETTMALILILWRDPVLALHVAVCSKTKVAKAFKKANYACSLTMHPA